MAKRLTPLQSAYQKEYRRLRKGFGRYTKEGYEFPEQAIPKNPKRVTQQMLQSLKETKPRQLKPVATKIDLETGELVQEEKKKSLKKISTTKVAPAKPKRTPKPKPIELPKIEEPTPEIEYKDTYTESDYWVDTYEPQYYPTMDIVDTIRDRINELPDFAGMRKDIPIESRKNSLLNILEDNLSYLEGDDKALYNYTEYLKDHQSEILQALERIIHDSKSENIDATFARVGQILNYGSTLSPDQSESLSIMQEFQ